MITETVYQQLSRISQIEHKDRRREALRLLCGQRPTIATLIQYTYHPDVKFDVDEIDTNKFSRSKVDDFSLFHRSIKKLKQFTANYPGTKQQKTDALYLLLSSIWSDDVDLLITIVTSNRLPWKTLNQAFCVKALPELFPAEMQFTFTL